MPFLIKDDWAQNWEALGYQVVPDWSQTIWEINNEGFQSWVLPGTGSAPAAVSRPPAVSVVTGIDPSEVANALYGKIIPLTAIGTATYGGGMARIGTAGLIFGPYFNEGRASFGVSFGFPANPSGERRVFEIALDGKVAWENAAGNPAGAIGAGFIGDAFDCRFYSGTMTQGADPLEAAMFGAEAVAYRPQMMLWFSNLDIAPYNGKVPFVSAKIGDVTGGATAGSGINLGEALEAVAYSPWLEYSSATFDTAGVQDVVQAMILTEDQSFLDLLQVTARVYRTLDVIQTDKLRVNDRGSVVTPDLILYRDHVSADGGVQYFRAEENSVPRELELITIDPDADYVFMPSKAQRPRHPVPVTSSVAKDSITLPVVIDANTRMSLVTYAKYQEDNARKRLTLQTMLYGYALEPGDLFRVKDLAGGFDNSEVWKVVESSHGANYINEIQAEAILKCGFEFENDPYWGDVILLLHADTWPPVDHSQYAEPMGTTGAVTLVGGASAKFGTGSFLFDGAGDMVQTNTSLQAWWAFGHDIGDPYCVELWIKPDFPHHMTIHQTLVARNGGFIGRMWHLYIPYNTGEIRWSTGTNSTGPSFDTHTTTFGANLIAGNWYHVAVDQDTLSTVRIYINGVMKAKNHPAEPRIDGTLANIQVGNDDQDDRFMGLIDDVRITKRSRYGELYGDASFSPPTLPFSNNPEV